MNWKMNFLEPVRKPSLSLMLIVLLAHAARAAPATWYVSKSGNNSNSGLSTNAAFLTIQKAASVMNAGDTCYILSGTYRETVTPAHSGTSSSLITFTAYPGNTPIVSGADLLNVSWSVYSNSIYQASTTNSFRQLFVDGVMMNEARWPNATVNGLLHAPRSTPTSVTLTNLTDTNLPSGLSLVGAYMHFFTSEYGFNGYAVNTRQITSWNPSNDTFAWSGNVWEADQTGCLYYLYGALSLLDIPTEWYLNTTSGTLYLWTSNSASPATHVVEIKARTNAFTLDHLSYVTVNGINVFGAGISMANTTNCVVNNCNLIYVQHNTTADWSVVNLPIANQVSGSGSIWENSTINYSSQDGIRLLGQNGVVSNCVIENVDYYPGTYYASVTTYGGAGNSTIVGNTLWYSGRYCVGVAATPATVCSNDMGYGELLTSDAGALGGYTANGQGSQFYHNWAHDSWVGIYTDNGLANYIVYDNVCSNNYVGLLLNSGTTNNLYINNTAFDNTLDIQCNGSGQASNQLVNNIWHTLWSQNSFSATDVVIDNGWYPPVGANGVLSAGSAGIHGGEYYTNSPVVEAGYNGGPPDIGAYQNGQTWVPGANFTPQPFPNPYALAFITTQPASQTNYVGQTAAFTVTAVGPSPLYYQWQAGATGSGIYTNLIAGGQFSAVTNATLNISNLMSGNALDYVVVITNANGSITSAVATLTVLNAFPSITTQPASQTNYVGQTATFTVTATGLPPLYYQWEAGATGSGVYTNLIADSQISAVTNSTLAISNLTLGNTEDYVLVVSNAAGSITSAVATLTVLTNLSYQAAILADNPVSYWPMQETNGPTIHDIVTTNAGPFNGTVQISTDGFANGAANGEGINDGIIHETFTNSASAVATDGATYLFGGPGGLPGISSDKAVYFTNLNGQLNNAQIAIGTGGTGAYEAQLDPSIFTAEAWINIPTYPIGWTSNTFQVPLGLDAQGNGENTENGWWMGVKTDSSGSGAYGEMFFEAGTGTTYASNGPSAQVFSGKWVYAVEEYNGTSLVVYTNGTLMVSNTQTYEPLSHASSHEEPLIIGSENSYYFSGSAFSGNTRAEFWNGGISHVAIYNYALAASRISAHYQAGYAVIILPPPSPTLSIQPSGTNVSLSWTNGFLQQAGSARGPWTDVLPTNETSPQVIAATNSQLFFRASSQP